MMYATTSHIKLGVCRYDRVRTITRGKVCADGPDYVLWKYALIHSVGKTCACACVSMCVFVCVCRCVCLHKGIYTLKCVHAYDAPRTHLVFRGTQTVKDDVQLLVGGPTPNKVLLTELVAPPPLGTLV